MISFDVEQSMYMHPVARIKVIGVGGAGGNSINSIIAASCENIECIAINTDAQALSLSKAPFQVQIGTKSTKGLGTGANPELGKKAAEEDIDTIHSYTAEADIVFLLAGLGGGTGTGALPVIARHLKEHNILTIAIVTRPFLFEGKRRMASAEKALKELEAVVDTLIVVPNQKLLEHADAGISLMDGFAKINQVIGQCVRSITDTIMRPGYINVDFADVKSIMKDKGLAVMGIGTASGPDRATVATQLAVSSPLLENMSIKGAQSVLINITGGPSLGLHEVSMAASHIYEQADEHANIILGSVIDDHMKDEITVTVIATGFSPDRAQKAPEAAPAVHAQPTAPAQQPAQANFAHMKLEDQNVNTQDLEVPTALRRMILAKQAQQQNRS